jgi:hypothetical protein
LTIEEGGLFLNGVPFDRINEGQRMFVAIELARQTAGSCGLILVDGIERLDRPNQKAFTEYAKQAVTENPNLQFIVTAVDHDSEEHAPLRAEIVA